MAMAMAMVSKTGMQNQPWICGSEQETTQNESSIRHERCRNSRNAILPLNNLSTFIADNFSCQRCHSKLGTNDDQTSALHLEVVGIASGLHFNCRNCASSASLCPDAVPQAQVKCVGPKPGVPLHERVNSGDAQLSRRRVMELQLRGVGQHNGAILAGTLDVNVSAVVSRWTMIQDIVRGAVEVGREALQESLCVERNLSPVGDGARSALAVASDARWDKRGSGCKCNSLSGFSAALGLRSQLVIDVESLSGVCLSFVHGASLTGMARAQRIAIDQQGGWRRVELRELRNVCFKTRNTSVALSVW